MTTFFRFINDIKEAITGADSTISVANCLDSLWVGRLYEKLLREYIPIISEVRRDSSYRHNNGFDKLSLFKDDDVHVRIHIGQPTESSTIHDHGWNLWSIVLAGKIRLVNYREDPKGPIARNKVAFIEERKGPGAQLVSKRHQTQGTVNMTACSSCIVLQGGSHYLSFDEPHMAEIKHPDTITFLVTSHSLRAHSYVFTTGTPAQAKSYVLFSDDEIVEKLQNVILQLESLQSLD